MFERLISGSRRLSGSGFKVNRPTFTTANRQWLKLFSC